MPWGASLDAAWRSSVRHSLSRNARWCFLFNGTHLRVIDAGRTFARRHIEFDLEAAADSEATARLLVMLASAASVAFDRAAAVVLAARVRGGGF